MKLKHQIIIDKYAGAPMARLLNLLIRFAGQLLRPDHSLDKDFKTIAIAKYKGMGSIVQCTPLLQTLRKRYPEAHIIFITTAGNKALLEKIGCIDELLIIKDQGMFQLVISIITVILKLWKRRAGVFLDLEIYSNASSIITSLSLARNRMGYYLRSSNYRMGMYTHMMFYNIQSPVSEAYLQFARLLGCREIITSLYPLMGKGNKPGNLGEKYIVVNANASDLRIERRWDASNFVALIDQLTSFYPNYKIVLIGNRNEAPHVNEIHKQVKSPSVVVNLAGKTTFEELIGTIEEAELMITNDTGPMHLGFALGTRIVALFGPCSPGQYGHATNAIVLYKNVYCSPCVHEFEKPPCNGNNQCMKLIRFEEVMEAVRTQMEGKGNIAGEWRGVIYQIPVNGGGQGTLGIVSR